MRRLLAVDDNQHYLTSTSILLEKLIPDCVVVTARSGTDGIAQAKEKMPDTILLDLHMPDLDGFEVCKRIKSDDAIKHIPIIMLTGVGTEVESRVKGLETGADAYLTKTIDSVELSAHIKAMLRIKKTEDNLRKKMLRQERLVHSKSKALRGSKAKCRELIQNTNVKLLERESALESKENDLKEVHAALRVLLKKRDEEKEDFQENILLNIQQLVTPYLDRLRKSRLNPYQKNLLEVLESNFNDITSSFVPKLSSKFIHLTPTELRVANMIKEGKTNKEIASILTLSVHTVITHRKNLRKKLGLRNKKTNLMSYLLSMTE